MQSNNAGFTLLEIMLAMLVLGVVVSMVSLSLSGSIRAVEATLSKGDVYYRAQVALDRLSEDLASAVLPAQVEFIGTAGSDAGEGELSFASFAHLVFNEKNGQQGMGIIDYSVIADEENPGQLFLVRSDVLYRPAEDVDKKKKQDTGAGFLLSDTLRSVHFSFFDHEGEEQESWDTTVEDGQDSTKRRLPAGVHCRLEYWLNQEDDSSIAFETTVMLPVGMIQAESEMESSGGL
jgi:general secretion pathway protein J